MTSNTDCFSLFPLKRVRIKHQQQRLVFMSVMCASAFHSLASLCLFPLNIHSDGWKSKWTLGLNNWLNCCCGRTLRRNLTLDRSSSSTQTWSESSRRAKPCPFIARWCNSWLSNLWHYYLTLSRFVLIADFFLLPVWFQWTKVWSLELT